MFQNRCLFLSLTFVCMGSLLGLAEADEPAVEREKLKEPVYRVTDAGGKERALPEPIPASEITAALPNTTTSNVITDPGLALSTSQPTTATNVAPVNQDGAPRQGHVVHPKLLAAVMDARQMLNHIQRTVRDYECLLVRREKVNGRIIKPEYIKTRIRHRQLDANGQINTPFTVYMKYLRPDDCKGRQLIYDENVRKKQLLVKEGGLKGRFLPSLWLNTNSPFVMKSSRYPVTDVGIENLTIKLLERGTRKDGNVAGVDYTARYEDQGWNLNGIDCKYLRVDFLTQIPRNESSAIEIFIDKQRQIPIRYVAYDWPQSPTADPDVLEEYTYLKVKLNVGLSDKDFSPKTYPGF